jgi:hypothetical protein
MNFRPACQFLQEKSAEILNPSLSLRLLSVSSPVLMDSFNTSIYHQSPATPRKNAEHKSTIQDSALENRKGLLYCLVFLKKFGKIF